MLVRVQADCIAAHMLGRFPGYCKRRTTPLPDWTVRPWTQTGMSGLTLARSFRRQASWYRPGASLAPGPTCTLM